MRDFNYTVNVLVKAYLDNTLEHANCTACAIGNIVADCLGTKSRFLDSFSCHESIVFSNGVSPEWYKVFCTTGKEQVIHPENYAGDAKLQIDITGYTWEELALIEAAFEKHGDRNCVDNQTEEYKDQLMFNGLMAVVDVLADIHGIDLTQKETAKLLFVK